jgi:hypothetical protein
MFCGILFLRKVKEIQAIRKFALCVTRSFAYCECGQTDAEKSGLLE